MWDEMTLTRWRDRLISLIQELLDYLEDCMRMGMQDSLKTVWWYQPGFEERG
jgi:hypothetical protein